MDQLHLPAEDLRHVPCPLSLYLYYVGDDSVAPEVTVPTCQPRSANQPLPGLQQQASGLR